VRMGGPYVSVRGCITGVALTRNGKAGINS
jgi:hypothetical protein